VESENRSNLSGYVRVEFGPRRRPSGDYPESQMLQNFITDSPISSRWTIAEEDEPKVLICGRNMHRMRTDGKSIVQLNRSETHGLPRPLEFFLRSFKPRKIRKVPLNTFLFFTHLAGGSRSINTMAMTIVPANQSQTEW
jgi:hypothetical protein